MQGSTPSPPDAAASESRQPSFIKNKSQITSRIQLVHSCQSRDELITTVPLVKAQLQGVKGKGYRHVIKCAQNVSQPQREHPRINYYSTNLEPGPYHNPIFINLMQVSTLRYRTPLTIGFRPPRTMDSR